MVCRLVDQVDVEELGQGFFEGYLEDRQGSFVSFGLSQGELVDILFDFIGHVWEDFV